MTDQLRTREKTHVTSTRRAWWLLATRRLSAAAAGSTRGLREVLLLSHLDQRALERRGLGGDGCGVVLIRERRVLAEDGLIVVVRVALGAAAQQERRGEGRGRHVAERDARGDRVAARLSAVRAAAQERVRGGEHDGRDEQQQRHNGVHRLLAVEQRPHAHHEHLDKDEVEETVDQAEEAHEHRERQVVVADGGVAGAAAGVVRRRRERVRERHNDDQRRRELQEAEREPRRDDVRRVRHACRLSRVRWWNGRRSGVSATHSHVAVDLFVVVSMDDTVSCPSCHFDGVDVVSGVHWRWFVGVSATSSFPGQDDQIAVNLKTCIDCHQPDHSLHYAQNGARSLPLCEASFSDGGFRDLHELLLLQFFPAPCACTLYAVPSGSARSRCRPGDVVGRWPVSIRASLQIPVAVGVRGVAVDVVVVVLLAVLAEAQQERRQERRHGEECEHDRRPDTATAQHVAVDRAVLHVVRHEQHDCGHQEQKREQEVQELLEEERRAAANARDDDHEQEPEPVDHPGIRHKRRVDHRAAAEHARVAIVRRRHERCRERHECDKREGELQEAQQRARPEEPRAAFDVQQAHCSSVAVGCSGSDASDSLVWCVGSRPRIAQCRRRMRRDQCSSPLGRALVALEIKRWLPRDLPVTG
ncbi:hypothetical protein PybrP1_007038 [[Pythium] brassicae (nom. inval.)]|nr:hypothetical protein PybrP1_007038 [[Pythium] brassicae (nom. inval.)]